MIDRWVCGRDLDTAALPASLVLNDISEEVSAHLKHFGSILARWEEAVRRNAA